MTGLEITLLCILTGVSTVSGVVMWKQHQEYKGYREGASLIISQLAKQLHYLQTQMEFSEYEDESSYTSMH